LYVTEPYIQGKPAGFGACGWSIDSHSASDTNGIIMAPYWPAMYPDNLDCFYKLEAPASQRIRLEFTDFDVYYGGDQ